MMFGVVFSAVVLCLATTNSRVLATGGRYPQEALECYASSAVQSQKEGNIVCPPGNSISMPPWPPRTRRVRRQELAPALRRAPAPGAGAAVCAKEVVNATSRADCGAVVGPHFGRDVWDVRLAQCVYRKCAAACPSREDDAARAFGGGAAVGRGGLPAPVFNRTSYCEWRLAHSALARGAEFYREMPHWLLLFLIDLSRCLIGYHCSLLCLSRLWYQSVQPRGGDQWTSQFFPDAQWHSWRLGCS